MKNKIYAVLLSAVFALCFAATSYAAPAVTILAGSSGAFASVAVAAIPSAVCGNGSGFIWAQGSTGGNGGQDPRAGVPLEKGSIWVVWDGNAAGTTATHVCAYLSVDSVVGNRLFFGTQAGGAANATLVLGGSLVGSNQIPGLPNNPAAPAALPAAIQADLNGQNITAAVSDIRPEDAQFATSRTFFSLGYGGLGGLGAGIGTPVCSAFTAGKGAQVVLYSIAGNDPISGNPVQAYSTINIGAYPVIVVGNTSGAAAGDLGNLKGNANVVFGNLPSHTLAAIWGGLVDKTTDLVSFKQGNYPVGGGVGAIAGNALTVLTREPISGTYNTFQYQAIANRGTTQDQEQVFAHPVADNTCSNPTLTAGGNPGYTVIGTGARWARVIGTGEMLATAQANNNSVGYAFWTYAAFAGLNNLTYFSIDGTDPFNASYTTGALPTCAALPCLLPFTNIKNGGYRVWNIIRVITSPAQAAAGANVATLVQNAQDQSVNAGNGISDFVPFTVAGGGGRQQYLSVFRSHYAAPNLTGVTPACSGATNINEAVNGPVPSGFIGCVEGGGDMAGAVFTWQNDIDSVLDTGNGEIINFIQ